MRKKSEIERFVEYLNEIIECKNYFKDKDYVLYLIFKDEVERVRDLIAEININFLESKQ